MFPSNSMHFNTEEVEFYDNKPSSRTYRQDFREEIDEDSTVLAQEPINLAEKSTFDEKTVGKMSSENASNASPASLPETSDEDSSVSIELSVSDQLREETLLKEYNPISHGYIQAFKDDEDEDSIKCLIFKYIASLGGFGAGIPGIAAALQAGEYYNSEMLGYLFSAATVLYTGGVMSWAIWEFIESSQSPQHHLKVDNDKKLNGSKISKIVGAFFLGALSSTPAVYVAYKYNTVKGIAVISFFYEWMFRSLGFYKFISPIKMEKSTTMCASNAVKYQGMEYVDQSKIHLLRLYQEGNGEGLLLPLKNLETPHEIYSYLSSTTSEQTLNTRTGEILPYYYKNGIPRKIMQYSALIVPLGGAFVNGVLTYKGFNLITQNESALVILTSISVLPTFILDSFATKQIAGGIFDAVYSCKTQVRPSDYFGFLIQN